MEYEIFEEQGKQGLRHSFAGESQVLIEAVWDAITMLEHLLFRVEKDGKVGLAAVRIIEENEDKLWKYRRRHELRTILEAGHQQIELGGKADIGCQILKVDGLSGLLDTASQRLICNPKYHEIKPGGSDTIRGKSNSKTITALDCDGRWNYISKSHYTYDRSLNNWIFSEPEYDQITFKRGGFVYGFRDDQPFRIT
jgi:hypothetical protein